MLPVADGRAAAPSAAAERPATRQDGESTRTGTGFVFGATAAARATASAPTAANSAGVGADERGEGKETARASVFVFGSPAAAAASLPSVPAPASASVSPSDGCVKSRAAQMMRGKARRLRGRGAGAGGVLGSGSPDWQKKRTAADAMSGGGVCVGQEGRAEEMDFGAIFASLNLSEAQDRNNAAVTASGDARAGAGCTDEPASVKRSETRFGGSSALDGLAATYVGEEEGEEEQERREGREGEGQADMEGKRAVSPPPSDASATSAAPAPAPRSAARSAPPGPGSAAASDGRRIEGSRRDGVQRKECEEGTGSAREGLGEAMVKLSLGHSDGRDAEERAGAMARQGGEGDGLTAHGGGRRGVGEDKGGEESSVEKGEGAGMKQVELPFDLSSIDLNGAAVDAAVEEGMSERMGKLAVGAQAGSPAPNENEMTEDGNGMTSVDLLSRVKDASQRTSADVDVGVDVSNLDLKGEAVSERDEECMSERMQALKVGGEAQQQGLNDSGPAGLGLGLGLGSGQKQQGPQLPSHGLFPRSSDREPAGDGSGSERKGKEGPSFSFSFGSGSAQQPPSSPFTPPSGSFSPGAKAGGDVVSPLASIAAQYGSSTPAGFGSGTQIGSGSGSDGRGGMPGRATGRVAGSGRGGVSSSTRQRRVRAGRVVAQGGRSASSAFAFAAAYASPETAAAGEGAAAAAVNQAAPSATAGLASTAPAAFPFPFHSAAGTAPTPTAAAPFVFGSFSPAPQEHQPPQQQQAAVFQFGSAARGQSAAAGRQAVGAGSGGSSSTVFGSTVFGSTVFGSTVFGSTGDAGASGMDSGTGTGTGSATAGFDYSRLFSGPARPAAAKGGSSGDSQGSAAVSKPSKGGVERAAELARERCDRWRTK